MFMMADEAEDRRYPQLTERQIRTYFTSMETRKNAIKKSGIIALISLGVIAVIWLWSLWSGSAPITLIILIGAILLLLNAESIVLIIKSIAQPFTDQEYDAWLEGIVREHYLKALEGMGIDISENTEAVLYIHGFVLPGLRNASKYRQEDILFKKCKDGKYRFSINIYTFYYPAQHRLAVCIFDINAVNRSDYSEATKEHYYKHIASTSVDNDQDTVLIAGQEYSYRQQRFALNSSDGKSVSATFSSKPVDNKQKLPIFDVSDSDVTEATIKRLRMLIASRNQEDSA